MKNPSTMTPGELAAIVGKNQALSAALAEAKPRELPKWMDGSIRGTAEERMDWERLDADGAFFDSKLKSGEWTEAVNSRSARIAAEAQAVAKVARDLALEKKLKEIDEESAQQRRLEDEFEDRRLGIIPGKPAA